jgi:hypothetical protein
MDGCQKIRVELLLGIFGGVGWKESEWMPEGLLVCGVQVLKWWEKKIKSIKRK